MLVFHEGLPGSGKSYAAIQDHLIPAVNNGQKVYTNIKGINHQAIAEICKIDVSQAQDLVRVIPWEQTKDAADLVENDCLVIIDEVQDFWPVSNKPLSPRDMEFVTQHRQRGLELVACGQVMKDCHSLWKRRVERKVMFVNRDAVGQSKNYTWTSYNASAPEVFEKIASGKGEYKPEVYACYKSHVDGVQRTDKTQDARFNIFQTKMFRFYLPLFFGVLLYALFNLWNFFHEPSENLPTEVDLPKSSQPVQQAYQTRPPPPPPREPPEPETSEPQNAAPWRVIGFYKTGKSTVVLVSNSEGQTRYVTDPEGFAQQANDIYLTIDQKTVATWTKPKS